MAAVWSQIVTFLPGANAPGSQSVWVGPPSFKRSQKLGDEQGSAIGTLRVGFVDDVYPIALFEANIDIMPAQAMRVGPVDLPMVLSVELPVRVTIATAAVLATPVQVSVSSALLPAAGQKFGATRSVTALAAAIVPVSSWVQSATVHAAGAQWVDAAAVPLAVLSVGTQNPRPRSAVGILLAANDTVIFGYTT